MLTTMIVLAATAALTSATNLFIADYSGHVTTAAVTESAGNYTLAQTSLSNACAPNPSWLTISPSRGQLYCLNEGLASPNGSLSSFTFAADGTLTPVQNTTTVNGPVSGTFYGPPSGPHAIALAHYGGSAVSTWALTGHAHFHHLQTLPFTLKSPGVDPARQDAPHEHEAITDPTGQYLLVPDLGADLVRVFSYDDETLLLTSLDPLVAAPGSGPRHAAFWNPYSVACESCTTYFFLVSELASTVTSYAVTYLPNKGGLKFDPVYNSTTFGSVALPPGNAPAEIEIAPDNKYLTISNRGDASSTVKFPNGATQVSDTLSTFLIEKDGSLALHQLSPAGGSFPRQFVMNAAGTLVAVGLQYDQEVVVFERCVETGLIGEVVGRLGVGGNVTCVVFDE